MALSEHWLYNQSIWKNTNIMTDEVLRLNNDTCSWRKNAYSKVFNVVFVLVYLGGVLGHGEKGIISG